MSLEANRSLVRRYIEQVINTGDVSRIDQFIAPGYAEIYNGERHELGLEGARAHVLGVRRALPDLRLTIERQIAEADVVVTQVTARGTHQGPWLGMQPTGRPMRITAVNIDRLAGGRIIEHDGAVSLLEPLLEAGAIHRAAPA